jgi:hypothetical protein
MQTALTSSPVFCPSAGARIQTAGEGREIQRKRDREIGGKKTENKLKSRGCREQNLKKLD